MNKLHKMFGFIKPEPIDYKKKRIDSSWSKPINEIINKRSKLIICEIIKDDSQIIDVPVISNDSFIHSIKSDSNLIIDCIIPMDYLLDS